MKVAAAGARRYTNGKGVVPKILFNQMQVRSLGSGLAVAPVGMSCHAPNDSSSSKVQEEVPRIRKDGISPYRRNATVTTATK